MRTRAENLKQDVGRRADPVGRRMSAVGVVAGVALLAFPVVAEPQPSAATSDIVFQPHRAVYDVTLARASAGSAVANIQGRMVYELSGDPCQGYSQKLRFVTKTTNQDGASQLNDLRTSSWERPAAKIMRFNVENYHDSKLSEVSKGRAHRERQTGALRVELKRPKAKKITLAADVLFPIAHSMSVLRAAKSGQSIFPSVFYDGSENGEKVYQTTAVIGKPLVGKAVDGEDPALQLARTSRGWPIAMSYYAGGEEQGDGVPAFEMSYHFHLNGVTSSFLIDHGAFAFKGRLRQLVFNGPPGCRDNKT